MSRLFAVPLLVAACASRPPVRPAPPSTAARDEIQRYLQEVVAISESAAVDAITATPLAAHEPSTLAFHVEYRLTVVPPCLDIPGNTTPCVASHPPQRFDVTVEFDPVDNGYQIRRLRLPGATEFGIRAEAGTFDGSSCGHEIRRFVPRTIVLP